MTDPRRRLPSVDALLRSAPGRRASSRFGREVVRAAIRTALDESRRGRTDDGETAVLARAVHLAARATYGLTPVINATGVVLHTNLGRAPLPERAVKEVARIAATYSDLEVERDTGARGRRSARAEFLLTSLTGAEDALVVNNNAAALLLSLAALARRKEVLVSRGELIEIGGEFRLPEIMAASGAKLIEVGTTNRTRLTDYRAAVTARTGLILKVHPSNYRVVGFSASPSLGSLSGVARGAGVPLLYDTGSGLLRGAHDVPADEPAAADALTGGADLVCFSGDKLLGGPQAGIVLGRAELVERLRGHPIARAVRVDKMTVAALEAVLRLHAEGRRNDLPAWRALGATAAGIRRRATSLAQAIPGATVVKAESVAGGGSLPGWGIPTHAVRLTVSDAETVAARLRVGNPSVFCRVEDDALLFDVRTVSPDEDDELLRAIRYALSQEPA